MIIAFLVLRHKERNGSWPLMKGKKTEETETESAERETGDIEKGTATSSGDEDNDKITSARVQEIRSNSS